MQALSGGVMENLARLPGFLLQTGDSGRRIRLRFAHQGGRNPPVIVIHGNQTDRLPGSLRHSTGDSVNPTR